MSEESHEFDNQIIEGNNKLYEKMQETNDIYTGEDEEDDSCCTCGGRRYIITCCDDLCRNGDSCMHGDGEDNCPDCNANGDKSWNY